MDGIKLAAGVGWFATLALVVGVCGLDINCALQIGTTENPEQAGKSRDAIAVDAMLDALNAEGLSAEQALLDAGAAQAPGVDADEVAIFATEAASAVATATSDVPIDAAISLAPLLHEQGLPEAEATSRAIIDAAITNLNLEPDDVADNAVFELELITAASFAIDQQLPFASPALQRQIEDKTVGALAVALDASLDEVQEAVAKDVSASTIAPLGEENESPLSGTADFSLVSFAGAIGILAASEFFRAGTRAFVGQ